MSSISRDQDSENIMSPYIFEILSRMSDILNRKAKCLFYTILMNIYFQKEENKF